MLLSISTFSLLALLPLARSQAVTIHFPCNDPTFLDPRQGYCLRPPNAHWDAKNPIFHEDTVYLGVPAKYMGRHVGSDLYSCETISIFKHPAEKQFCCHFQPKVPQDGFALTKEEFTSSCALVLDEKKSENPSA